MVLFFSKTLENFFPFGFTEKHARKPLICDEGRRSLKVSGKVMERIPKVIKPLRSGFKHVNLKNYRELGEK